MDGEFDARLAMRSSDLSGRSRALEGGCSVFAPFTSIEKCIGKEITVHVGGAEYVGMMAGIYSTYGMPMIVLTPLSGKGLEQHVPLSRAVISVRQDQ